MAVSTGDGAAAPAWQAEPAEAATPPEGRFLLDEDGCPRWYRTQRDAVLPLAVIADERMEP